MPSKLERAAQALKKAREERDRLIVEASEKGMSRRAVGRAVGLTAPRIQHIVATAQNGGDSNSRT